MTIKAIFTDYDNTLAPTGKHVPEEILDMVKTLRSQGIRIHVITGRQLVGVTTKECYKDFITLTDDFVATCGAVVVSTTGKTANAFDYCVIGGITMGDAEEVVNSVQTTDPDAVIVIEGMFSCYTFKPYEFDDFMTAFFGDVRIDCATIEKLADIYEGANDEILSITVCSKDKYMESLKAATIDTTIFWKVNDEVCQYRGKVNKLDGLIHLCKKYGYENAEIMYVGDGDIDIECLQYCKYSVAMANGAPEVREAGKYTAPECEKLGWIDAVNIVIEAKESS